MVRSQLKWIDENTAVASLPDGSIFIIDENGNIRHYPGGGWKKPRQQYRGKPLFRNPFWLYRIADVERAREIINEMYKI